MSTRCCIAIKDGEAKMGLPKFHGVYSHFDGYPEEPGVGWQLCQQTIAEIKDRVDNHPGGWSQWDNKICYCHNPEYAQGGSIAKDSPYYREDAPSGVINSIEVARASNCRYLYIVDPVANTITAYSLMTKRTRKLFTKEVCNENQPCL